MSGDTLDEFLFKDLMLPDDHPGCRRLRPSKDTKSDLEPVEKDSHLDENGEVNF